MKGWLKSLFSEAWPQTSLEMKGTADSWLWHYRMALEKQGLKADIVDSDKSAAPEAREASD